MLGLNCGNLQSSTPYGGNLVGGLKKAHARVAATIKIEGVAERKFMGTQLMKLKCTQSELYGIPYLHAVVKMPAAKERGHRWVAQQTTQPELFEQKEAQTYIHPRLFAERAPQHNGGF